MKAFCILLCQKPIEGTFASNVLRHGCGALWIDGGRVALLGDGDGWDVPAPKFDSPTGNIYGFKTGEGRLLGVRATPNARGRFPANVVLEAGEVEAGFPETGTSYRLTRKDDNEGLLGWKGKATDGYKDSGTAVRFFKQFGGQST